MVSIGITGGKGGTGKSTIAVNLAFELAKSEKVDLIDLDVECPNDSRISGIKTETVSKVYKPIPKINEKCVGCGICINKCEKKALYLLNKKARLAEDLCEGCMLCKMVCPFNAIDEDKKEVGEVRIGKMNNLKLIEGRLNVGEDESTRVIKKAMEYSDSEIKIIDTAAGTHCTVVKALKNVDHAFVIVEPTRFSVEDAKKIIEVLKKFNIDYDVILNKYGIVDFEIPFEARFKIPYSKEIIESYTSSRPISGLLKEVVNYVKKWKS